MKEHIEHPPFFSELIELYVGSWKNQAVIYFLTFALAAGAGLVSQFAYHLPPQKLAPLVLGFTTLMVLFVPTAYVLVHRLRTKQTLGAESKPVRRQNAPRLGQVYYLEDPVMRIGHNLANLVVDRYGIHIQNVSKETSKGVVTLHSIVGPSKYGLLQKDPRKIDKDLILLYLSQEFEEVTKRLLIASPNLSSEKGVELRKDLEKSFAFALWFIVYSVSTRGNAPQVSFEEALKTYSRAIEEARR